MEGWQRGNAAAWKAVAAYAVHQFDPDSLRQHTMRLSEILGKHNKMPDSAFDPKELAMGIQAEMEHTNDRQTAENIAKDHLYELPDYYSRLKKMEKGL